ncbi:MAG: DJ-1/PfpI/YhbO family deglycase/protease [Candidatus Sungbacteria bacterium]|nr:DJ-1/PfpI/YhbO family deglycase/protease [Candidatus Sungbacteria bacterium]
MKKALIIAGKFVQDVEYVYPFYRLQEAGFKLDVAVKDKELVFGVNGIKVVPTRNLKNIKASDYDILILPGGARCMEYLRQEPEVIKAVAEFHKKGKVIACICHGTQLLISARIVKDKKISGYYSIKDDIENAGATYVDAPAVVDGNIVTSPHYNYMGDWMREALNLLHDKK